MGRMDYRHEEFQFEEGSRVQVFDVAKKQETLHCHDCLELNRIESGTGNYIIGGKVYEICPGDIFVINNRERHLAVHKEPVRMTVILFSSEVWKDWYNQDYLKPFFQRTEDFSNQIRKKEEGYDKLDQTFSSIKEEAEQKETGWRNVLEAAGVLLLSYLYRYYAGRKHIAEEGNAALYPEKRTEQVFSYIEEHFREEITLQEIADSLAVSKTYLCRYFKEMTNQTVFEYVEQVRIQYACCLLKKVDLSIAEISLASGFGSVSLFNRMFKKYMHMTPGEFRK